MVEGNDQIKYGMNQKKLVIIGTAEVNPLFSKINFDTSSIVSS